MWGARRRPVALGPVGAQGPLHGRGLHEPGPGGRRRRRPAGHDQDPPAGVLLQLHLERGAAGKHLGRVLHAVVQVAHGRRAGSRRRGGRGPRARLRGVPQPRLGAAPVGRLQAVRLRFPGRLQHWRGLPVLPPVRAWREEAPEKGAGRQEAGGARNGRQGGGDLRGGDWRATWTPLRAMGGVGMPFLRSPELVRHCMLRLTP
mmetsp:Transcript_34445/g.98606  ORF Transcript_34445/g.98606 Transcript_34445/m.98606 type:complete len:202 (-) Transcript_34445:84-689(-)